MNLQDLFVKHKGYGLGIITYQGAGRLHIVEGSMNKTQYLHVLQTRVKQEMEQSFPAGDEIFQQDKAPAHTAKICKQYLQEANINVRDWLGNSPDFNVIENLWAIVKRKLWKIGGSRSRSEIL